MKKLGALLLALLLISPAVGMAQEPENTVTEEISAYGVTVMRNHEVSLTDKQRMTVDYPTFVSDNKTLESFLREAVTTPLLALQQTGQMAEDSAYQNGATDVMAANYLASMPFPNLLSVEGSVINRAVNADKDDISLFYAIVSLQEMRTLTVDELFVQTGIAVDDAIRQAVFAEALKLQLPLPGIMVAADVPMPDSYYLTTEALRVIYLAGALDDAAVTLNLPWEELSLTPSAYLTGQAVKAQATSTSAPEATVTAAPEPSPTPEALPPMTVEDTSSTATPMPDAATASVAVIDPDFSLAPVITPTPMPLEGNDAIIGDVLTNGLWKPLGTDGNTYYQFTEDGKLLTVTVEDYALSGGVLVSGSLSGTLDIGSDSAFTLYDDSGNITGYVLNRQGERVAPEEFVTPSPTPVPTPTPSPSPSPSPAPTSTPTPSPTPSPAPTPTLSPYEQAVMQAPVLAALGDASFENARTLEVYAAPGENTYRVRGAQVTTDDSVAIYGVENGWVLVSYTIGNGSRGRIGYIENITLADADNVAQLGFCSISMTLTKDAEGTDDPLYGKEALTTLKEGDEVTLLAFMGKEWAYVQAGLDDKVCRLFIPQSALMEE